MRATKESLKNIVFTKYKIVEKFKLTSSKLSTDQSRTNSIAKEGFSHHGAGEFNYVTCGFVLFYFKRTQEGGLMRESGVE